MTLDEAGGLVLAKGLRGGWRILFKKKIGYFLHMRDFGSDSSLIS
jgi:hypothetical protein